MNFESRTGKSRIKDDEYITYSLFIPSLQTTNGTSFNIIVRKFLVRLNSKKPFMIFRPIFYFGKSKKKEELIKKVCFKDNMQYLTKKKMV